MPSPPAPPAPRAASCFATEAVRQGRPEPPLPPFQPHPSPRLRQIKGGGLQPHQPSRPQEFLMGGKAWNNNVGDLNHPKWEQITTLQPDPDKFEVKGMVGGWAVMDIAIALGF